MREVDELAAGLNLRMTSQRRALLKAVAARPGMFTAFDLHHRAREIEPRLGLATTYRMIELLSDAGVIRALVGQEPRTYVRCRPGHHHHLVCVSCGGVEETELCGAPSPAELARRHGFAAATHELEIYGTCAHCTAA